MEKIVYILGTVVTFLCFVLLLRAYLQVRKRLLLWSAICFLGLSASNALVYVDLVIFPEIDLYPARLVTAAVAMLVLMFGLIWEGNR